jgi:hypothetical protein
VTGHARSPQAKADDLPMTAREAHPGAPLFILREAAKLRHATAHFSCCDLRPEVHGRPSRFAKKVNDTAHFFDSAIPRFLPEPN